MRSLNRGNIEWTNGLKIDVWFLYMDFCFTFADVWFLYMDFCFTRTFAKWLVSWIDLRKHVDITEKRFSVYILPISYDFKKNLNT